MNEIAAIPNSSLNYYQRRSILTGTCYEDLIDNFNHDFHSVRGFFNLWQTCQNLKLIFKCRLLDKTFRKLDSTLNATFDRKNLAKMNLLRQSLQAFWMKEFEYLQVFRSLNNTDQIVSKIKNSNSTVSENDLREFRQSQTKHANELSDFCNFIYRQFECYEYKIKDIQDNGLSLNALKIKKIFSPTFALFCSILLQSGIFKKHDEENNKVFCERVSNHFKLEVNIEKTRQNFREIMDIKLTDKTLINVRNQILPVIDRTVAVQIDKFIRSKTSFSN